MAAFEETTPPATQQLIAEIDDAWREAVRIIQLQDGWTMAKHNAAAGDRVEMRKNSSGQKIYRCRGRVNMPASLLEEKLRDTNGVCTWNTTLTQSKVLAQLSDDVSVSYQVTASAAGGMVSARDFVFGSKWGRIKDEQSGLSRELFVTGGKSVSWPNAPKSGKLVRAVNGPGCQMVIPVEGKEDSECEVVWLMDCDYKGWMPSSILDAAMPTAQVQFLDCVRKLAAKLKDEGKF